MRLALIAQRRPSTSLDRCNPQVSTDWKRLSQKQTVPVLVGDDLVLTDSGVTLEILQNNIRGLLFARTRERAQIWVIVRYADAVLGRASRERIFEKRDKREHDWNRGRIAAGTKGYIDGLPCLGQRLRGRCYLSEDYSLAECALLPRIALMAAYGAPVPGLFSTLTNWFDRMLEKPGFEYPAPPRVWGWLVSQQT